MSNLTDNGIIPINLPKDQQDPTNNISNAVAGDMKETAVSSEIIVPLIVAIVSIIVIVILLYLLRRKLKEKIQGIFRRLRHTHTGGSNENDREVHGQPGQQLLDLTTNQYEQKTDMTSMNNSKGST